MLVCVMANEFFKMCKASSDGFGGASEELGIEGFLIHEGGEEKRSDYKEEPVQVELGSDEVDHT